MPAEQLPEWTALAPAYILAATAMVLFVIDSIDPDSDNRNLLAGTAIVGTLASVGVATWFLLAWGSGTGPGPTITLFGEAVVVDGTSLFFTVIVTTVTALVLLASYDYLADDPHQAEYYSLIILAATGMVLMASSNSLATVFVSLELASLPSYALVSILKRNRGSSEAGLKYFLIGALSSAIFVYGISLVYGATGSLILSDVAAALDEGADGFEGLLGVGVVMLIGGFAFKTASVPFHFWAPEAYEGAPAPVSAFLSSASKAAGFVIAFRVFVEAFPLDVVAAMGVDWALMFQVLAVVTMIVGNFAAAVQSNVKRMLAYSSIGHAGYALIGLAAITGGNPGHDATVLGASMMHLLVYGFMNTGAFLFIALVEHWDVGRTFDDYRGLARTAPFASLAMAVFMFSLAGLPPFSGFASKYVLFLAAIGAGYWWLAAVGAVTSALSLYYYSRVVKALWLDDPIDGTPRVDSYPRGIYVAIIAAAALTVLALPAFGVGFDLAETAATALFE